MSESEVLSKKEKSLEDVVLTRLMRLNAIVYGLVFGIIFGLVIFIATIWLVIKGGPVVGPTLSLLNQFFIGYKVTWLGSIIGFVYGFVTGFLIGFLIAYIYNKIADIREGRLNSSEG
jgi:tetrahydromethanopterin S-methyltransferase subunit G